MDWLNLKNEDLYHIVFRNRNKEYGSFVLRKKYPKTLFWSVIAGIAILLLLVSVPFASYYFEGPAGLTDNDFVYEVEYMPINPPEANDLSQLAKALAKPPEEKVQVPVVKDTVEPPKETPPPEPPREPEQEQETDSIGTPGGIKDGTGSGEATGLATVIDVFPRFPGGDDARLTFLRKNVRYPQAALTKGVQGVVVVVFIIEKDGSLSGIRIEKGIGEGCDEESMRVVGLMPKWDPGKRQGKPVRVMVRMPVVFRIPGRS